MSQLYRFKNIKKHVNEVLDNIDNLPEMAVFVAEARMRPDSTVLLLVARQNNIVSQMPARNRRFRVCSCS